MSATTESGLNWARVGFAFLYLVLAIGIFVCYGMGGFSLQPQPGTYNFPRFAWCFACSSVAFAALALVHRRNAKAPWLPYSTYYPVLLATFSAGVFSVFHAVEVTSGFIFYYASGATCSILAFQIDHFWKHVESLIERAQRP